jgi:hypothetical protein
MLSKKVFLASELNFSAPSVHAARVDVRDHVESHRIKSIAHRAPVRIHVGARQWVLRGDEESEVQA